MKSATINVLMTGAGAPGAPGIISCLLNDAAIHLTVADADPGAVGKHLHNSYVQIPKAGDDNFIESLFGICTARKIQVVLPLVTRELFPLSKNKNLFEDKGIRVLVSSETAIAIANNKSASYRFLLEKNIQLPPFRVVQTINEFESAVTDLGFPGRPVCFKPSVSNGSRGFRIISNDVDEFDLLFNYKPNNTYISFADALRILASHPFPELLVSEYLPGDEYSVDCLANNGNTIVSVPRLRRKMINGISVQGEIVNDRDIIEYCRQIIGAIGLHGNVGLQVKRNVAGKPMLLEINPRVQGTIVAAMGAGINLPLLAIKQEMGLNIEPSELNVHWGTRFSRYWTEVFYD